jgi:hypothetical protein
MAWLAWAGSAAPDVPGRVAAICLKKGAKASSSLKELSGTVTARVLGQATTLLSVGDVLESAGKTAKGTEGGSIHVVAVTKERDGSHGLRLEVQLPGGPLASVSSQGDRILLGDGKGDDGARHELTLMDREGKLLRPASLRLAAAAGKTELHVRYLTGPGQGAPAKLALGQRKSVRVELPFTLRDVPLP